jgi:hypothetical protein
VRHGRLIAATLKAGSIAAGTPIQLRLANSFAPYLADTDAVWLRVNGEVLAEPLLLTSVGGPHDHFRLLAPSSAEPGAEFQVRIVSLDAYENAASTRFESQPLLAQDGTKLADVPAFSGWTLVPLKVADACIFRCSYQGVVSNAVWVEAGRQGPYWGDTHIHSKVSHDGQGADPYGYARDVSGLDFAASADHFESTGPEGCRLMDERNEAAYEPGTFVTLPADERNPRKWTGHHNLYFRSRETAVKDWERIVAAWEEGGKWPPEAAYDIDHLTPDEAMLIPHHTGISFGPYQLSTPGGAAIDADKVDDRGLRPAIEIYSHHGQSDYYAPHHILSYEFNRHRRLERRANTPTPGPHYAQDYWMKGRRWGVIASSDEHTCQGGRKQGGIAAVWAPELTREGVFDAIRARRSYGTTGERILLDLQVDGAEMGEEILRPKGAKLPIRLRVWGTDLLMRVELLRHRFGVDTGFLPLISVPPRPETTDYAKEVEDTFEGPCMYYLRVSQEPVEWPAMAWSSPVWVDVQ